MFTSKLCLRIGDLVVKVSLDIIVNVNRCSLKFGGVFMRQEVKKLVKLFSVV